MQRRCIHDEYGKIDPVKAQERSKPRVVGSSFKRPRDEGMPLPVSKKQRQAARPPGRSASAATLAADETMDDATADDVDETGVQAVVNGAQHLHAKTKTAKIGAMPSGNPPAQLSYASPPAFQSDAVAVKEETADPPHVAVQAAASILVSPPTSLADETDIIVPHETDSALPAEPDHDTTPKPSSVAASAGSRHSSRQPRHVERYVPEAYSPPTTTPAARKSTTPGRGVKKPVSRPSSSHSTGGTLPKKKKKASHSPVRGTTAAATWPATRPRHEAEEPAQPPADNMGMSEVDAESLRLIRELQEQEFGLRRRPAAAAATSARV